MPRSSCVYIVYNCGGVAPIAAFTVKYEAVGWIDQYKEERADAMLLRIQNSTYVKEPRISWIDLEKEE